MVESTEPKKEEVPAQESDAQTTATEAEQKPAYSGDLGDIEYTFVRDTPIEQKQVPTFTYGRRVRIAALHASHE